MEVVLAMLCGSIVLLAATQLFATLRLQSQNTQHYFGVEQRLHQVLFAVEKDLRRSGFCAATCEGDAVTIGQFAGEAAGSCVLIAYDFNRRGGAPRDRETFGYRLRAGALEAQVGVQACSSGGWERRLDPLEVTVTHFQVIARRQSSRRTLYEIRLGGHWSQRPEIRRQVVRWVAGRNA